MNSITINISMPKGLYIQAKTEAKKYHYSSVSEFIRDATRKLLYPELTENGLTKQFESMVLKREKNMDKYDTVEWDGKTPFTKFVLNNPPKKHVKTKVRRHILDRSKRIASIPAGVGRGDQPTYQMV
jgi:Arc/MetJ-type ribon-helix-helix transcriptional regulator